MLAQWANAANPIQKYLIFQPISRAGSNPLGNEAIRNKHAPTWFKLHCTNVCSGTTSQSSQCLAGGSTRGNRTELRQTLHIGGSSSMGGRGFTDSAFFSSACFIRLQRRTFPSELRPGPVCHSAEWGVTPARTRLPPEIQPQWHEGTSAGEKNR